MARVQLTLDEKSFLKEFAKEREKILDAMPQEVGEESVKELMSSTSLVQVRTGEMKRSYDFRTEKRETHFTNSATSDSGDPYPVRLEANTHTAEMTIRNGLDNILARVKKNLLRGR